MLHSYRSVPQVSCFDGDDAAATAAAAASAAAAAAAAAAGANNTGDKSKTFTQDDVNKMLAEDRRKHKAALESSEKTYKELLETNQNLSATERKALEDNLESVRGQLLTKEELMAKSKKELEETYSTKLSASDKKAQEWESRFKASTVTRTLQDAAISAEAFSADQIVTILASRTKLVEDVDKAGKPAGTYRVMVEVETVDPTTGETAMSQRTPAEAMKWMKDNPERFGNLFKAGVVSGIGANSTAGLPTGAGGGVDLAKLAKDPVAFRKVLKENPAILGMKSNRLR